MARTVPSRSHLIIRCSKETALSSIWIPASGPDPMITLSNSPIDSIRWPLGPLICRIRPFRGEIMGLLDRIAESIRSEVVHRLLQLRDEIVPDSNQVSKTGFLPIQHVRAFRLGQLPLDGDIREIGRRLLPVTRAVRLLNNLLGPGRCGERKHATHTRQRYPLHPSPAHAQPLGNRRSNDSLRYAPGGPPPPEQRRAISAEAVKPPSQPVTSRSHPGAIPFLLLVTPPAWRRSSDGPWRRSPPVLCTE